MRLSALPGDPGYREDAGEWDVRFNGDPLPPGWLGVTADEEEGVIRYFLKQGMGVVTEDAGEGDKLKVFEARGRVQLIRPEDETT